MPKKRRIKPERRSRHTRAKYGRRASDISDVFGMTPRKGDGEDLSEAAGLQRAEAAAHERDRLQIIPLLETPRSGMLSLTTWTSPGDYREDGYAPEDGIDTGVDTDNESESEEAEEERTSD